jgi:hypothetical protein
VTTAYRILVGGDSTLTNDFDHDSLADAWEIRFFGDLAQDAAGDLDLDGLDNYDTYAGGGDPNKVQFLLTFPNSRVNTSTVFARLTLLAGIPSYVAILLNDTNRIAAT